MGYSPWVCKESDATERLHLPSLFTLPGEALGALPLSLKEAGRQHQGQGATARQEGLGQAGNGAGLPIQPGFRKRRLPACHAPAPEGTAPHPTRPRPHLRRSSGGGIPRRRFTHC